MYIAIDIGGTNTRLGLFSSLNSPDFSLLARFPTSEQYTRQLELIGEALSACDLADCQGIGVSLGGRMAKDGRSLFVAPNLPDHVGKPFADELAALAGCPSERVRLAHDPVCGLLGEKAFGSIKEYDRSAYMTLSTGTGVAFQLRTGATSLTVSTEFAHQLLDGNELVCICGQVGCLETFTGGRQLEMRLGHSVARITDQAFWETFSDKLALGLVNLVLLTRVEAITISGAIALHNPFLLPLVQRKVDALLKHGATLRIVPAHQGENAPLIGAVALLSLPADSIIH